MNPYKKLSPFKWFVIQNFPFIEADFDAITEYQLLCKVVEYLNKTIDKTNELGEKVEELNNWFINLDVQDEIDNKLNEMSESGELAEIIAQYLELASILSFNTLNDLKTAENLADGTTAKTLGLNSYKDGKGSLYKIRELINTDIIDNDKLIPLTNYPTLVAEKIPNFYLNTINEKLNLLSVKEHVTHSPLFMLKQKISGTTGDTASFQSLAVQYDNDGVPEKIYVLANYNSNSYARLYILTCGNRLTGEGWSYTYTDLVPNTHGSSITYKDNYLYIADVGTNKIGKLNVSTYNYEEINLSELFSSGSEYIVGISYDELTNTFLLCGTENVNMYVVNEDFTEIIRSYTHDFNISGDYIEQTYDFHDNIEIRCVSASVNNLILFIDTYTGKLIKTSTIDNINGEIESVSYKKGYITTLINNYNPTLDGINMSAVIESYIGGYDGNDFYEMLENRPLINNLFLLNNQSFQYNFTYYFQNNNLDNNLVRYVGLGTETNPFKSALGMLGLISSIPNLQSYRVTINILESSNTDDSYIKIYTNKNLDYLIINGNSNTLNGFIDVRFFSGRLELNGISIATGNTRRTNGDITLFNNADIVITGTNESVTASISENRMIKCSGSLTCSSTSTVQRNVFIQGDENNFTGDTLTFSNNYTL